VNRHQVSGSITQDLIQEIYLGSRCDCFDGG
jgi:hypothetical protein